MSRTYSYSSPAGRAHAYRQSDYIGSPYTVTAQSANGSHSISLTAYRDEAGFSGRDWRVANVPGETDTLGGDDQFSGLKDVALAAIAHVARTAELSALKDRWNALPATPAPVRQPKSYDPLEALRDALSRTDAFLRSPEGSRLASGAAADYATDIRDDLSYLLGFLSAERDAALSDAACTHEVASGCEHYS